MIILTNRDLYTAVIRLMETQAFGDRSLEQYLKALWALGHERAAVDGFTGTEFFDLLYQAGTAAVPPFDEAWRIRYDDDDREYEGFAGWEARILRQIVDLREFEEASKLDDKHRYFGIVSPRGQSWYNFSPATFLEGGAAGYFRGWSTEADGSRGATVIHVYIDEDGKREERAGAEFAEPVFALDNVTWKEFRDFLVVCQIYE